MIKLVHPLSRAAPLNVSYFSALKNDILLDKMDRKCVLWLTIALNTINFQLECNDNESGEGSPRLLSGGEQSWLVLVINIIWE